MVMNRNMTNSLYLTLVTLLAYSSASVHAVFVIPDEESHCMFPECLKFNHLLVSAANYFTSESELVFISGNYNVENITDVVVKDTINLSLIGNTRGLLTTAVIHCNRRASFTFINATNLYISGIQFIKCGLTVSDDVAEEAAITQSRSFYIIPYGVKAALIFVNVHSLTIESVNITESPGYGLLAINLFGTSKIINSFFHYNGPHIANSFNYTLSDIEDYCSAFNADASSCKGGNALIVFQDINIPECPRQALESKLFVIRSAFSSGLGINSDFPQIESCDDYYCAIPGSSGLGIISGQSSYAVSIAVENATFDSNRAFNGANMLVIVYDMAFFELHVSGCFFKNANIGWSSDIKWEMTEGGILFVSGKKVPPGFKAQCKKDHSQLMPVTLKIHNCTFSNNSGYSGSAMFIKLLKTAKHQVILIDRCDIRGNFGGALQIEVETPYGRDSDSAFHINITGRSLSESTSFTVAIMDSTFCQNMIPLSQMRTGTVLLSCVPNATVFRCDFRHNQGSAIASIGSTIYFKDDILFWGNLGSYGGALALFAEHPYYSYENRVILTNPTTLIFHPHTHLNLVNNIATEKGGAIFVEDLPVYIDYLSYPCFYQVMNWNTTQELQFLDVNIRLENNSALVAGNSIYGGMEDGCIFAPEAQQQNSYANSDIFDSLFTILSPWSPSELASAPHALCICQNETIEISDCFGYPLYRSVYPGQTFQISTVVLGQLSNFHFNYSAVPALIRVEIDKIYDAKLGIRQNAQHLGNTCGEITLNVATAEAYVDIYLMVDKLVQLQYFSVPQVLNVVPIYVDLLPCPLGFKLQNNDQVCGCILPLYHANCTCSIDEQTIQCQKQIWVGNLSNNVIVHNHCPFDYCAVQAIAIHLEYTDEQCALNRSGILCGGCQLHFSLALGTSQCLRCSNYFLFLIIIFTLVGILLVVLLQFLNLTVSVGTINGLIYVANIIRINHTIFFTPGKGAILSTFIAWLNLDLGIQVCFYDGMDMYAKTWLQFVFPMFMWILVFLIIKLSYHSVIVSKLVRSNAVPVLATLFLLSYAKLLRTIITVLSFTHLTYPDGTVSAVWLYDGNVPFLKGKHAALFVMALIMALGFILPYTLLLLLSPCLQTRSAHRGLHWVNKLKPFLDAYHGPYKDKFRNWTGIMLVVRLVQFMIFAFNTQGDPNINLLVIVFCTCIHVIAWNIGTVYKNHILNIIESNFIISLGIYAGASLYIRTGTEIEDKQNIITNCVVGTTFVVFVFIVIFHIVQLIKPHWNKVNKLLNWRTKRNELGCVGHEDILDNNIPSCHIHQHNVSTVSYVELREPLNLMEDNT